jgi:alkylated DNA repair dioxygenase AlkB
MKSNIPISYEANWVADSKEMFEALWTGLDWVRHPLVPRREYYVNTLAQSYSYGRPEFARTYESQALPYPLYDLWARVRQHCGIEFETVFLNGYEDGSDHLGWHSDDSPEMDDARPIVIVTLGAEREIWFRERPDVPNSCWAVVEKLKLGDGSICVMKPGMQDTHQHRIPKAGFVCGPRISLTFRGYVHAT